MKRFFSGFLCMILCMALLCNASQASLASSNITLTAVNDAFLPLSASTMPVRRGGAQYLPYTVFSGALGISGSYAASEQTLTLSNGVTTLNFNLSLGTVFDQNMNSYSTPAYRINGSIYVPVKLVCGKFGFTYSNISAVVPILRICNSDASLSDSAFVSASTNTIQTILDAYHKPAPPSDPAPSGGSAPVTPVDPATGQAMPAPVTKPSTVYLAYLGTPNHNTKDILNMLEQFGKTAAFFVPADGTALNENLLREIVGRGHTIGFTLLSSAQDMTTKLRTANDTLFHATGTVSRLLCISDGSSHLNTVQKNGLSAAGYRLWDAPLDSGDHSYGPSSAAKTVTQALSQTTAPTVIRMGQYASTARTTELVCSYLSAYEIPVQTITLTRTPPNSTA